MSTDTTNMNNTDKKSVAYGAKLKATRESMGLEQKDIAAQLRLGERIIDMLESGHYASSVPTTFIRGYIRSYSKLLQIPESEVAAALEPIKPVQESTATASLQPTEVTTGNSYSMQFSTYAIVGTIVGMIGLWWYNHNPAQPSIVAQTMDVQDIQKPQENKQVAALTQSPTLAIASTANTSSSTALPTANSSPAAATTPASTSNTTLAAATPANPTPAISPAPTAEPKTGATTPTKKAVASKHRDDDDDDDDDDHDD